MHGTELAAFLEHSVLRPDSRARDVDAACDAALVYRFRGVCVTSGAVAHAKRRLLDTGIKVVATVGFPHGTSAPDIKAHEAMRASAMGADEVDYVISVGAALDGDWKFLFDEAVAVIRGTRGKIQKAILEVGFLNVEQICYAARTVVDAGIPYVKTCTGFGPSDATVEDVRLLVEAVGGRALVKAAGGVRDREHALALLAAGAAVVGTSRGPQLCSE
jgi:deoxyribose-phosphate aldolase